MDDEQIVNAAVAGFTDEATGRQYRLDPESGTWQHRPVPGGGGDSGMTHNAPPPRQRRAATGGMSFELVANSDGGPYRDEEVAQAEAEDVLPLPTMPPF